MLVVIAVLLALIPTIAILYPFIRRRDASFAMEDETSMDWELSRRWDASISGLKSAELEHAIGNLAAADYAALREQYMTDAATVLKAMELQEQEEQWLLAGIEREVRQVRQALLGKDDDGGAVDCPDCGAQLVADSAICPECGHPYGVESQPGRAKETIHGEHTPDD